MPIKDLSPRYLVQIKFGSHLYGTATPESDLDIKAVYLPRARDILLQRAGSLVSDNRAKAHGEKNTAADIDREAYSLQRYLELLAEGQTVALDMLFAPEWAMISQPDAVWAEVQALAPKILTKGATAFVRYCRQQANKYGIKGSRVAATRQALALLLEGEQHYGATTSLQMMTTELEQLIAANELIKFSDLIQPNGAVTRCLEVCGKKAMLTASIKNAREIVAHMVNEYGQRALAAERNEGVDWKALSHAIRVGHEALELLTTGTITFPRPEAAYLLQVKLGKIPYIEVAAEIERLLERVEFAAVASKLPEIANAQLIDDFVAEKYWQQVIDTEKIS